jgi:uncharacterized membrane protein YkoI
LAGDAPLCPGTADADGAPRVSLLSAPPLQDAGMKTQRMIRRFITVCSMAILVVAITAFTFTTRARAGHHDRDDHVEARALLQRGEILPLSRILELVQQKVPGDVVEVELERSREHGWQYEVKVLTAEGRVRKVKLDAASGTVRKIEDD